MTTRRIGAALGLVAALVAGCTSDRDARSGTGPRPVTLVTYSAFVLADSVKAALEREAGLSITIVAAGDAAEALNRAVLASGSPEGDVLFGVDNTLLGRATATDAFAPSEPPSGAVVPERHRLDPSGRFHAIDTGAVCVDFDSAWFEARQLAPPTGLEDLADHRYRDLLVIENPATSSPGLAFLAAVNTQLGSGATGYWERLRDNGVAVVGTWDDAWQQRYTVNGGDRPLVVSYASSPPAEVVYSEGRLATPSSEVIEGTCVEQVEFAALLRNAAHPAAGADLIEAMLGTTWQEALPLTNFVFPIRADVALPDVFSQFAVRPASPISLDPAVIDRERDRWLADFRDTLG